MQMHLVTYRACSGAPTPGGHWGSRLHSQDGWAPLNCWRGLYLLKLLGDVIATDLCKDAGMGRSVWAKLCIVLSACRVCL